MYAVDSRVLSIVFCVITMLCWGSWANTQKLTGKKWRFELFYWDYVWGILLSTLLLAFTLGSNGETGRGFLDDLNQAENSNLISAGLGGVIFNLANILLVAAITLSGMSVAFPIAIGIALIQGVIVNYIHQPVGNIYLLGGGVVLVMLAILLDAAANKTMQKENALASKKGVWLSLLSGVLMGLFYRFVAEGMTTNFKVPESGKLTPYTALVFFSVGIFVSNLLFNTILMKKPVTGPPVSFRDYFKGRGAWHFAGILGGIIWSIGMSLNILASGKAGFAVSYGLGQGATLIAALWGVLVWKEFKGAPSKTMRLIAFMFLCYSSGLVCIVAARFI